MSSWAKPGVKCVCVDDQPFYHPKGIKYEDKNPLRKGDIYTIKHVYFDVTYQKLRVYVEEAKYPGEDFEPWNNGFAASRFRPLISQSDDIAMFKVIADEASGNHRADEYKRKTQEIADRVR